MAPLPVNVTQDSGHHTCVLGHPMERMVMEDDNGLAWAIYVCRRCFAENPESRCWFVPGLSDGELQ